MLKFLIFISIGLTSPVFGNSFSDAKLECWSNFKNSDQFEKVKLYIDIILYKSEDKLKKDAKNKIIDDLITMGVSQCIVSKLEKSK